MRIKLIIIVLLSSFALLLSSTPAEEDKQAPSGFQEDTLISFYVPDTSHVQVTIYNVIGKTMGIAFDLVTQGQINIPLKNLMLTKITTIDSLPPETTYVAYQSLTPGVYYYKVVAGGTKQTKKLLLLK